MNELHMCGLSAVLSSKQDQEKVSEKKKEKKNKKHQTKHLPIEDHLRFHHSVWFLSSSLFSSRLSWRVEQNRNEERH